MTSCRYFFYRPQRSWKEAAKSKEQQRPITYNKRSFSIPSKELSALKQRNRHVRGLGDGGRGTPGGRGATGPGAAPGGFGDPGGLVPGGAGLGAPAGLVPGGAGLGAPAGLVPGGAGLGAPAGLVPGGAGLGAPTGRGAPVPGGRAATPGPGGRGGPGLLTG